MTSVRARANLAQMGIEVRTGVRVTAIDGDWVQMGDERSAASTVLWAAGVKASPLIAALGLPTDRGGRVRVEGDCSLPGHPCVFCIGDAAAFVPDGQQAALPGVSPV